MGKFNLIINKLPKFYKINISIYIYHVRQITAPIRISRKIDNFKKNDLNYWFTIIFINCITSLIILYTYISRFFYYMRFSPAIKVTTMYGKNKTLKVLFFASVFMFNLLIIIIL